MLELLKYTNGILCAAMLTLTASVSFAAPLQNMDAIPHLDPTGRQAYRDFLSAPEHRAFAIAPGGYWSWQASQVSAEAAGRSALFTCRELAGRDCALYALDGQVVFDAALWKRSWRPYLSLEDALKASIGTERNQRFPDLKFRDRKGKESSVSAQQGKVLILHFWGSWCPSCRTELPNLARLQRKLSQNKDVRLVLLQVREDFQEGRSWIREQGLKLPLYDSGMQHRKDATFTLRDGNAIPDRVIAPVFPSTYVLDRNGIVVFSHVGTLTDWPGYLPLLQDVARHPGKTISRPLPSR